MLQDFDLPLPVLWRHSAAPERTLRADFALATAALDRYESVLCWPLSVWSGASPAAIFQIWSAFARRFFGMRKAPAVQRSALDVLTIGCLALAGWLRGSGDFHRQFYSALLVLQGPLTEHARLRLTAVGASAIPSSVGRCGAGPADRAGCDEEKH